MNLLLDNTAMEHRQLSLQTKLIVIIANTKHKDCEKHAKVEHYRGTKVGDQGIIATNTFDYFKLQDSENARNQHSMV